MPLSAVTGPGIETCVLTEVKADPMDILVYERAGNGTYTASNEMRISSWSWSAQLSLMDVLGRGTDWRREHPSFNCHTR
jgi:hypothetical protein